MCKLLLVLHCNYVSILHRFGDIQRKTSFVTFILYSSNSTERNERNKMKWKWRIRPCTNAVHMYISACARSVPLGMMSGAIQDWQISASSTTPAEWDEGCHERFARLYYDRRRSWCAKYKAPSEWLQIDLGVASKVPSHLLCFTHEINPLGSKGNLAITLIILFLVSHLILCLFRVVD